MPYTDGEEGTLVAGGKHVVPEGVAVEELDGGAKKLRDECPDQLRSLLAKKGLTSTYDELVRAIAEEGKTRSFFGHWKTKEFEGILDLYRDQFSDRGVKIVFCKRKSGSGERSWIEFVDVEEAPEDYVSQYDASNHSGQVIKTIYTTLEFPHGVAVEEFSTWGGRKKLKEKVPIYVEKLLTEKDLMNEYNDLVDACVENGIGRRMKMWNTQKLKEILDEFNPMFERKGIALFLGFKQEYVSHGQYGGHMEKFRWLEFVDREKQPNYFPQRDADTKKECVIS